MQIWARCFACVCNTDSAAGIWYCMASVMFFTLHTVGHIQYHSFKYMLVLSESCAMYAHIYIYMYVYMLHSMYQVPLSLHVAAGMHMHIE